MNESECLKNGLLAQKKGKGYDTFKNVFDSNTTCGWCYFSLAIRMVDCAWLNFVVVGLWVAIEDPELLVTDKQYQSVLACANNHLHWVVEQDPSANDCSTGEPDEVGKGRTTKELYIVMNNEVVSKGR